jgi:phage-related protein (TIGR01555 family)
MIKENRSGKMAKSKLTQASFNRMDNYMNVLSGLGGQMDKTRYTKFGAARILYDQVLTEQYVGDGYGKKIVTRPADDMTKNWINIPSDPQKIILKEMKRLKATSNTNLALRWKRLYRGGLIVIGAKDGQRLTKPLNMERVKSIEWLRTYSAPRVMINNTDFVTDINSKNFDDIETFRIRKKSGGYFTVHKSRCMIFKGEPVPDDDKNNFDLSHKYWGMSALQSIYNQVVNYGSVEQSIVNVMHELILKIFKLNNLPELLSEGCEEKFYKRMETFNASMSLLRALMIGPNDEFERNTANLAGVPDILDRFMMNVAGVSGIPVTLLFGRSPGGQNATGDSDFRNYYDMIESDQTIQLEEPLQYLATIINSYTKAVTEGELEIVFNPVWTPSAKEQSEIDKNEATVQQSDIDRGVITPDESRQIRYPDLEQN